MRKRNKSKKPLVVGDWVLVRIAGMGRDNYQIESIEDLLNYPEQALNGV